MQIVTILEKSEKKPLKNQKENKKTTTKKQQQKTTTTTKTQCLLLKFVHNMLSIPSRHMTLIQRRLNVDATSWRCIDVAATLYNRHVPADGLILGLCLG